MQVRQLPDTWSFAEGAAHMVNAITVYYGLKSLGDLRKGGVALIHSAAAGCGLHAIAICESLGARAIGIVGTYTLRWYVNPKP